MAIVPSGRTRVMKAQVMSNPLSQGFDNRQSLDNNLPSFDTEEENQISPTLPQEQQNVELPEKKTKDKSITNYIFKKLEGFGYPGRRLEEFKSKFVRESLSPDGIKDVQIELPDKKYSELGQPDPIGHNELKEISREMGEMFGLNFNGAERSDGKWTVKFTSQKMTDPEEEQMHHDNLEEVYGTPSAEKKGRPIKAYTLREMIKEAKNKVMSKLKKICGV